MAFNVNKFFCLLDLRKVIHNDAVEGSNVYDMFDDYHIFGEMQNTVSDVLINQSSLLKKISSITLKAIFFTA